MKIAMFVEVYEPFINGVVTHVKLLSQGLRDLGHEVLIVTADADCAHHYIDENGVLHCPAAKGVKRLYGYPIASPISRHRRSLIKEFNPDVIHIHTEFSIGQSGIMMARYLNVPMVYTMHTMYDEYVYYIAPKTLSRPATKLARQYFLHVAGNADAITGPSRKVEQYLKEIGVKTPVKVINNAAELSSFAPGSVGEDEKAALKARLGIKPDETVAVFVGRLGREKSVDVLLGFWHEAVSPADGLRLVIVGDGPVRPELEAQAADLGLEGQVIFTGRVEHDNMPPYIAIGDVYVTASLSDTNSISMLEGMAGGLPVLQLTDPMNADQVIDGVNGYSFDDAEQMAARLRQIRDMTPDERRALSESVIRSVRSSGADDLAKKLLAVYTEAMARESALSDAVRVLAMEFCRMNGFSVEKLTKQKIYKLYDRLVFAPEDEPEPETADAAEPLPGDFYIKTRPSLVYSLNRGKFEFTEFSNELLK